MIAIVVPYYKLEFFEVLLSSLAAQTDKRFKVYIGDDASPENPLALLEPFRGRFDFDYFRFEQNLGRKSLVQQWNRCISRTADEPWLLLLGDDDVLHENVIESFYRHLSAIETSAQVVRFATYKMDEKGQTTSMLYQHPQLQTSKESFLKGNRSSLSEYVFRKEPVHQIGFKDFPLAWYSDWLAVLEFSGFGNIYTINEAAVGIRISAISISGSSQYSALKTQAAFEFYQYLLVQKKAEFSQKQLVFLLSQISRTYLYNKKQWRYFIAITQLYFQNLAFASYFKFLKLVLKNYLKQF